MSDTTPAPNISIAPFQYRAIHWMATVIQVVGIAGTVFGIGTTFLAVAMESSAFLLAFPDMFTTIAKWFLVFVAGSVLHMLTTAATNIHAIAIHLEQLANKVK